MSGITPLLDTLLHQVLGPKGDQSAQKNLNQPVRPVEPGEGPRALQSDSRTDSRAQSQPHNIQPQLRVGSRGLPPQMPTLPTQNVPNASAQTQLSHAGRAIADILLHYPRPGSVIKPSMPLIQSVESTTSALLGDRLNQSIRTSGVFYEHTLSKWLRGEVPRSSLQQQPQMQVATQIQQQEGIPMRQIGVQVPEAMHSLVRHQLEVLSTPVLRWEGDVWSGLFMALVLQPAFWEEPHKTAQDDTEPRKRKKVWHSDIELTVKGLGHLVVHLALQENSLHLQLTAEENVIHRLEDKQNDLRNRLNRLGLSEVVVETKVIGSQGASDE
ncbi:flagellar hook-length control protein FliK [Aliidiomarina halalkaliphila]|uniref:Flagellar hook-length control protein FliK n=1 Tax=Aliidiomarina halalkaliphila TaxID=2593535 RepID=A0A552X2I9_9GAMM|nr:flagellar hook-length control protein FliK [Aliidiomarina halalkaliphila]TRW48833.1 flagellar hook-length control protein FliK [Aliidiomarina halalkaliphila]